MRIETKELKNGLGAIKAAAALNNDKDPSVTLESVGGSLSLSLAVRGYSQGAGLTAAYYTLPSNEPLVPVTVSLKALAAANLGKIVTITETGETLSIASDNGITANLETVPRPDRIAEPAGVTYYPADLELWARVATVAGVEDSRPILTGVFLSGASIVATDSYRLRLATYEREILPECLISARAIRLAAKYSENGTLGVNSRDYEITAGAFTLRGLQIDGDFPNFRQLINSAPADNVAAIPIAPLEAILVAIIGGHKGKNAKHMGPAVLVFDGQRVTVSGNQGTLESTLDNYGDPIALTVGYSPAFLLDLIRDAKASGDDHVTLELYGALKPLQSRSNTVIGQPVEILNLLMPVRLDTKVSA